MQAADALVAIEEGTSEEAGCVVLCSREGLIEFASSSSHALLERYQGIDNGRVRGAILRRREVELARH